MQSLSLLTGMQTQLRFNRKTLFSIAHKKTYFVLMFQKDACVEIGGKFAESLLIRAYYKTVITSLDKADLPGR